MPIRPATPADLAAILGLARSAPTAAHWSTDQHRAALTDPSRLTLIAEENSQLVGFVIARGIEQEWELENIVVAARAQRRGMGTQLMSELLRRVGERNASAIFLEVRESNVAARRLYENCGLAECGRRKNYYQDPQEDAILYRKML